MSEDAANDRSVTPPPPYPGRGSNDDTSEYGQSDPLRKPTTKFEEYQNAFNYTKEHRYYAYWFGNVPIHISIPHTSIKIKLPFLRKRSIMQKIVEQLYLMGLYDDVNYIYEKLPNYENDKNPHKKLLDTLYQELDNIHKEIKDNYNKQHEKPHREKLEKEAERLEKMIGQYADEIGQQRKYSINKIAEKLPKLIQEVATKLGAKELYEIQDPVQKINALKETAQITGNQKTKDKLETIEKLQNILEESKQATYLENLTYQYIDAIARQRRNSIKKFAEKLAKLIQELNAKKKSHEADKLTKKINKLKQEIEDEKESANQHYAYIDSDCVKLLDPELPTPIKVLIVLAALLVALGQGLVVGYFLMHSFPMWFALGVCATAGFIVNYSLFKGDFSNLLKEIYINGPSGFFKDEHGNWLSLGKRIAIGVSGVSCFAAATALGFITFNSVNSTVIGLLAVAGASSPLGAAIFGGIIAVCTTMCLAALLFMGIRKFIKDETYKEILKSLKKDFYDVWQCDGEKPWGKLDAYEKLKHVSIKAAIAFKNLFSLLLKVSPAIIVFFAMRGLFHAEAVKTMTTLFHWSAPLANTVATAIIDGAATIANGFFYSKGMIMIVEIIEKCFKKCASSIHLLITDKKYRNRMSNYFSDLKTHNPIRLIATIIKLIVVPILLLACIALNSFGQALGANDPTAFSYVHSTVIPASFSVVTPINETLSGACSAGLNVSPSFEAIELTPMFNKSSLFADTTKTRLTDESKPELSDDSSAEGLYQENPEISTDNPIAAVGAGLFGAA